MDRTTFIGKFRKRGSVRGKHRTDVQVSRLRLWTNWKATQERKRKLYAVKMFGSVDELMKSR